MSTSHHVTSCFSSFSQVHEEIGYDITPLLNPDDFIEVTMNDQKMTLFIVCDVPRDAKFETLTRKEISVSPMWERGTEAGIERGKMLRSSGCGFTDPVLVGDRVGEIVRLADVETTET